MFTTPRHDPPDHVPDITPSTTRIDTRGPAEFLGVVPYILGFHPEPGDALVIGLHRRRVVVLARADLDLPPVELATGLVSALHAAATVDSVVVVGYGASEQETTIAELALTIRAGGYPLAQVLRVHDSWIWCLICDCLGPQGMAFDPSSTAAAAQATLAGLVALPSRAAMLARVAPDPAATRFLNAAIDIAARRLLADPPADVHAIEMIDRILERARAGQRLDDDTAATLLLLLVDVGWRDHAWVATGDQPWLGDLWCDLTRRTPRRQMFPAPAALAAWSAWRVGNTILARAAVDIALHLDPDYRMAVLVRDVLAANLAPTAMTWPPDGPAAARGPRAQP